MLAGVLGMEAVGVKRVLPCWLLVLASSLSCSLALVITDSVSLAVDSRWNTGGRLRELGVRRCRWGMRVFLPTACTSSPSSLFMTL